MTDQPTNEILKIGLPKFSGAVAKVLINELEVGILISEFDRLDISSYLNRENNQIEVLIIGTLQNLLGWHNSEEVVGIAKPESFYFGTGDQRFESIGLYEGILIERHQEM